MGQRRRRRQAQGGRSEQPSLTWQLGHDQLRAHVHPGAGADPQERLSAKGLGGRTGPAGSSPSGTMRHVASAAVQVASARSSGACGSTPASRRSGAPAPPSAGASSCARTAGGLACGFHAC